MPRCSRVVLCAVCASLTVGALSGCAGSSPDELQQQQAAVLAALEGQQEAQQTILAQLADDRAAAEAERQAQADELAALMASIGDDTPTAEESEIIARRTRAIDSLDRTITDLRRGEARAAGLLETLQTSEATVRAVQISAEGFSIDAAAAAQTGATIASIVGGPAAAPLGSAIAGGVALIAGWIGGGARARKQAKPLVDAFAATAAAISNVERTDPEAAAKVTREIKLEKARNPTAHAMKG
jgi:hypothetical protein